MEYKGKYEFKGQLYVELGDDVYPYLGDEAKLNEIDEMLATDPEKKVMVKATFRTIDGETCVTRLELVQNP